MDKFFMQFIIVIRSLQIDKKMLLPVLHRFFLIPYRISRFKHPRIYPFFLVTASILLEYEHLANYIPVTF